jgi:hypothetical protein
MTFDSWWDSHVKTNNHLRDISLTIRIPVIDFVKTLEAAWHEGKGTAVGFAVYLVGLQSKSPGMVQAEHMRIVVMKYRHALQSAYDAGEKQKAEIPGLGDLFGDILKGFGKK